MHTSSNGGSSLGSTAVLYENTVGIQRARMMSLFCVLNVHTYEHFPLQQQLPMSVCDQFLFL